eukprot:scaffold2217_cov132-Isochrysis_galbana.AAC.6
MDVRYHRIASSLTAASRFLPNERARSGVGVTRDVTATMTGIPRRAAAPADVADDLSTWAGCRPSANEPNTATASAILVRTADATRSPPNCRQVEQRPSSAFSRSTLFQL